MNNIINSPLLGLILTLATYEAGLLIRHKTRSELMNPLLIAMLLIVGFLKTFNIPYSAYALGGDIIGFFLGPLTVALALPLYRQRHHIIKHWHSLLLGITLGITTSYFSVVLFCKWLNIQPSMIRSSLPKSITTPMAVGLSNIIGGIPAVTVAMVIFSGITGALLAPAFLKCLNIHNPIAKGISIGASSHALGTSKAFELGQTEGAMSSISIGLTGILTVLLLPIFIKIFPLF